VRRAALLVLLVLLVPVLVACGQASPDLFEVLRSGQGRNAKLDMVVNDGGSVMCNGREHPLNGDLLLRARELARELAKPAELALRLPPGPNRVLSYRVRLEQGTVSFSDTSPHQPQSFFAVQQLTKDISEDVCRLSR
jgi:hypothetical protein